MTDRKRPPGAPDGRTVAVRHAKTVHDALVREALTCGPATEVRKQLIRRATGLVIALERVEARLLSGQDADTDAHVRLIGALSRVLRALGLTPAEEPEPDPAAALARLRNWKPTPP